MTNKILAASAALALLIAGGSLGWTVSRRGACDARLRDIESDARTAKSEAVVFAAEVARLRDVVGLRDDAAASHDGSSAAERERPHSTITEHAARIAVLEKSVAAMAARPTVSAAASPDDVARRKSEALQTLLSITDPEKRRTIRDLVQELVKMRDAVVPDILAALNTDVEHTFYEGHSFGMSAGVVTGWGGTRMALLDILRQIETPAANAAFLAAVGKSRRLSDYRDLLTLYPGTKDPVMVKGISALVPDMLRKVTDVGGLAKADEEAMFLSRDLASFIERHELTDTAGAIEDLLMKAPARGGVMSYEHEQFFRLLSTFAPERAARVALSLAARDPEHRSVATPSSWLQGEPFDRQIAYYETLFSQGNLDAPARRELFDSMSVFPSNRIKDSAKRIEDAKAFVVYLEGKLAHESDAGVRGQIEQKLAELRGAIEQTQKRQ